MADRITPTDASVKHHVTLQSYSPVTQQTPAVDSTKVAFDIGGSEEADLDSKDFEPKDLDCTNGQYIKMTETK